MNIFKPQNFAMTEAWWSYYLYVDLILSKNFCLWILISRMLHKFYIMCYIMSHTCYIIMYSIVSNKIEQKWKFMCISNLVREINARLNQRIYLSSLWCSTRFFNTSKIKVNLLITYATQFPFAPEFKIVFFKSYSFLSVFRFKCYTFQFSGLNVVPFFQFSGLNVIPFFQFSGLKVIPFFQFSGLKVIPFF